MTTIERLIQQIENLSPAGQAKLADYVAYLQWLEAGGSQSPTQDWSFSFIEAFGGAAVRASDDPAGMDVKMEPASAGGERRAALWAHPPVEGQTIIEYHVPVPQQIEELHLRLAVGIRDGAQSDDNLVAFGIKVNGLRVWGIQRNEQIWQPVDIPLTLPVGDVMRFEFTTEALVNHRYTWAVWGNPELAGRLA